MAEVMLFQMVGKPAFATSSPEVEVRSQSELDVTQVARDALTLGFAFGVFKMLSQPQSGR